MLSLVPTNTNGTIPYGNKMTNLIFRKKVIIKKMLSVQITWGKKKKEKEKFCLNYESELNKPRQ